MSIKQMIGEVDDVPTAPSQGNNEPYFTGLFCLMPDILISKRRVLPFNNSK